MATWNGTATLTTPAGTITFNAASGDTYFHDPTACAGLDMAPIRSEVDDKPQTDGGIVHDSYFGARHVTLGGVLVVRSSATESGAEIARAALEASLEAKLTSIMRADGTYTWTEGGGSRSITVRCDQPCVFTGGWQKTYLFGLVAASPTIS